MSESIHIISETEPVLISPCMPPAPWIGGKSQLASTLCPIIDAIPHTAYVEPFIGMGGIFFRRARRPKCEIINDWSKDVTNLFRILNRHFPQFCDVLKWQITSREEFDRLKNASPESLTDLERAARFLYLQRTCFGGKVSGRNFGVICEGGARFDLTKLVPMLEDIHSRLTSVIIENLDYKDLIPRYDRPGTLFYCDPPYYECESDYGKDAFSRDEFPKMAEILSTITGKFILSINDHPEIRRIFDGFLMRDVEVIYTIAGTDNATPFGELIISNFDLADFEQKNLFS